MPAFRYLASTMSRRPRWLTPDEIAEQLAVSRAQVEAWIDALYLRAVALPPTGERRIDPESYNIFLKARKVRWAPPPPVETAR